MPSLIFSSAATRDLLRLLDFLDGKSSQAAAAAIRSDLRLLSQQPGIGRRINGQSETREWSITFGRHAYRVRYVVRPDAVLVLRIKDSREDA